MILNKNRWWFACLLGLMVAACNSKPSQENTNKPTQSADTNTHAVINDTVTEPTPAAENIDSTAHWTASILAGLPISESSALASFQTAAWNKYRTQADSNWAKYNRRQTTKMTKWADIELANVRSQTHKVFYPFSGPDFLNVNTFFPEVDTIVMIGLEPLGALPALAAMSPDSANKLYPRVEKSLYSVLSFSFFQTISMAKDLKTQELNGTLPLITLFMARRNQTVVQTRYVHISPEGELQEASDSANGGVRGTEIIYQNPNTQKKQVLYYYSVNLVDFKLKQNKTFLAYLDRLGTVTTYLKSASYLLHKGYFSTVANVILNHSQFVLQDDSGMPLRHFPASEWDGMFYGTYDKPIDMFARHYQPDLYKAYHPAADSTGQTPHVRKLPFGIGYDWRVNASNLMLFTKK
ncbi:hypothetical protein [Flexibacter flexilis]|uniref:hypothetical protein n=1 Tax=Flexibacter flexilis TaxID=998 RepID=UPI00116046D2|nr:hypothetical protein [Flexibacter flexilis]